VEEIFVRYTHTHGVNDIRQTEMHTVEPVVPEPSPYEVEIAIEEFKRYIDEIPVVLTEAGRSRLLS
jgi:hypothetical protein